MNIDRTDLYKICLQESSFTYHHAKYDGREGSSNETFPGLFGRELDEWCAAKKEAKHVGHDVVTDDHGSWNQQPVGKKTKNLVLPLYDLSECVVYAFCCLVIEVCNATCRKKLILFHKIWLACGPLSKLPWHMWQVGGAWGEGAPFPIQEMVPLHLKRAINATYTTDTTLGGDSE